MNLDKVGKKSMKNIETNRQKTSLPYIYIDE